MLKYRLKGACAVGLGRLPLWALAAGGERCVRDALELVIADYIEALDFSGADLNECTCEGLDA
ncbi:alpha-hydroxy-acid oxidizing protein [Maritimibacter sp. 55A14]|uniref:alpha-hydroxy-acid oxidizing protein n=1 Tax=Maritimibacter sp. 55A14 TaxID=2174844 RepID=UPI001304883F